MSNAKLVVCPYCDSINRVPADRLDQRPNCGVCHKSLLNGQPLELTQANSDRHIAKSDLPVLMVNGLDKNDAADAATDPDTDTFTNLQEYQAGSDPNDAGSTP
jgi:hypothetical protein